MKVKVCIAIVLITVIMPCLAAAADPVPPCPWPIPAIESPEPGMPDNSRSLLGDWSGSCEFQSRIVRNVRMIVWQISGTKAQIYLGVGNILEGEASRAPKGGWSKIDAEIVPKSAQIKWQRESGWPVIFTLKVGEKLIRVDSGWGTWYETTLTKSK